MTTSKKILLAFSGGVDSSVSIRLLQEQGFDVEAATMILSGNEDIEAARELAEKLGVKYHAVDLRRQFKDIVQDNFYSSYCAGQTPNPCIMCNINLKFGLLRDLAKSLGAQYFATGHYVNVANDGNFYYLEKAKDLSKDQSYVLYFLKSKDLENVVFPLGNFTKDKTKSIAKELELFEEITESQDICFIPDGDYISYFKKNHSYKPVGGAFEFVDGRVLGHYEDFNAYTIGQRKGLGIAYSEPLYVIEKNKEEAKIIVGRQEDLFVSTVELDSCSWNLEDPSLAFLEDVQVRWRYHQKEYLASVEISGESATVKFKEAQAAVAPGQTLVAYSGNRVLGGGKIIRTFR